MPRFALRRLGGRHSPILERGDVPKLPGPGSSQRNFEPLPRSSRDGCPIRVAFVASLIYVRAAPHQTRKNNCKYLIKSSLLGHDPMLTEALSPFPDLTFAGFA
jgi:hypothetical protein